MVDGNSCPRNQTVLGSFCGVSPVHKAQERNKQTGSRRKTHDLFATRFNVCLIRLALLTLRLAPCELARLLMAGAASPKVKLSDMRADVNHILAAHTLLLGSISDAAGQRRERRKGRELNGRSGADFDSPRTFQRLRLGKTTSRRSACRPSLSFSVSHGRIQGHHESAQPFL